MPRDAPSQPKDSRSRLLLAPVMAGAVVATGAAAGAAGGVLTLLLHLVQHLSFGYTEDTFLLGVEHASAARRVAALAVGGAAVGPAWWWLRRGGAAFVSVDAALRQPEPRLPFVATVTDAVVQIAAVGVGASLGREGAPRQVGAAAASWIADRLNVSGVQRRTLLASGAGAGLAAVYNVPLGGALFAAEILLGSAALVDVVPALLSSGIATAVAWSVLGDRPTYVVAGVGFHYSVLGWAFLCGPLAGVTARGFNALMVAARELAPTGWRLVVAVATVFTLLGVTAIWFPQLLGNGKGPAQLAFDATLSLPMVAALTLLKPLATAACLASGARGGLLTPALATGALLGSLTGALWQHLWSGGAVTAFALVGAAAVLAATQQAPLTAIVLVIEFTHTGQALIVPIVVAVALAVGVERVIAHRTEPEHA